MPYRFRRARTRTAYALLAVNIVLYAMSVIHWIVNSVVILGVVSAGRAEDVIVTWFPTINVRMACSSPRHKINAGMKVYF